MSHLRMALSCCFYLSFNFLMACDEKSDTPSPSAEVANVAQDDQSQSGTAPTKSAKTDVASTVPSEKHTWDLSHLYVDTGAWELARQDVLARIERLKRLQGTLGSSAQSLLAATDEISLVYKDLVRLYSYASLKADEDTRIAENEERRQIAQDMMTALASSVSWYNPELLRIGEKKVGEFVSAEPALAKHAFGLSNTLRRAPHTLSEEVEAVMAATGKLTSAANSIYDVLTNANLPWPEVKLSDGETLLLSQAGYTRGRQAENRDDRKMIFDTFWGVWKAYEASLGSILNNHIQGLDFGTKVRKYDSSLGRALFDDNMPEAVYRTLVQEVNVALPTLHRYFQLRKRMLNIEGEMRYYDIYPTMVELDKTFTLDDSIALTRKALAPLGEEFMAAYDKGVAERWMHVYPAPGKKSGAYMSGLAYDVHPYVLLNHNDDYESATTFAHEYGHAVHSVLANATQPWETADYSTFTAETASIMNEMLLQDMMVKNAANDQERLYYLGVGLESLRGTFFRQTMFAEFELKINEEVEAGNVLTGEKLSQMYLELLKRYHGHDQGVMKIDDLYAIEWAYIPHFYYDFYVFQYATSIAAAAGLAEKISQGDVVVRDAYINMLKAGGSDYPYQLMKSTGMDMATPEPYKALVVRMNSIMDQMEAILAKSAN